MAWCINSKIMSLARAQDRSIQMRKLGYTVVATNGVFDLLHPGHVHYLEHARSFGNALFVGLNSDASVTRLKGPSRPIMNEMQRADMVAALESVTCVTIFDDVRCTEFLNAVRPDVYVKGGDYTLDTMNEFERGVLQLLNTRITFVPLTPSVSTTMIINRIVHASIANQSK